MKNLITKLYDSRITSYLSSFFDKNDAIPNDININVHKNIDLRYGENPHQKGSLYATSDNIGLVQLNGKCLSYNNYNDIFSALSISAGDIAFPYFSSALSCLLILLALSMVSCVVGLRFGFGFGFILTSPPF